MENVKVIEQPGNISWVLREKEGFLWVVRIVDGKKTSEFFLHEAELFSLGQEFMKNYWRLANERREREISGGECAEN